MRRLPGRAGQGRNGRQTVCRMGSRLRKTRRMLFERQGHGQRQDCLYTYYVFLYATEMNEFVKIQFSDLAL